MPVFMSQLYGLAIPFALPCCFDKLRVMLPRTIFFDMDDTLLDGWSAMTISWETVCHDYAPRAGCEADALRLAIRKHATEFWSDEAAVGHWRVALDEAREIVVRNALTTEGCDPSLAHEIAYEYGRRHSENLRPFEDAIETLESLRGAGY
jgi:FMN phosphatase YigB (HAD superfamily)